MNKLTKGIILVLAIVMVLGVCLVGCKNSTPNTSGGTNPSGNTGGEKKEPIKVGLFLRTFASNYYNATKVGAENGIKAWNEANPDNQAELLPYDHNSDIQKELNNVEDGVNQKIDVAVINPIDPQGSMNAIEILTEAKIITVDIDGMANNSDLCQARIQSKNEDGGRLEMEMLCKALNGKGNILMFCNSTNANSEIRKNGAMEELKKWPDINLLYTYDGENTVEKSLDAMQNFMQTFQAEGIDGVWAFSDSISQGAASAVTGTALEGKTIICGLNGDLASLELIKSGQQYGSVAQFPEFLGAEGVKMGLELFLDPKAHTNEIVMVPMEWVDKTNVDEHITRWDTMAVKK